MTFSRKPWFDRRLDKPALPPRLVHLFEDSNDPHYESKTHVCLRCYESFIINHKAQADPVNGQFVMMSHLDDYVLPAQHKWCEKKSRH